MVCLNKYIKKQFHCSFSFWDCWSWKLRKASFDCAVYAAGGEVKRLLQRGFRVLIKQQHAYSVVELKRGVISEQRESNWKYRKTATGNTWVVVCGMQSIYWLSKTTEQTGVKTQRKHKLAASHSQLTFIGRHMAPWCPWDLINVWMSLLHT